MIQQNNIVRNTTIYDLSNESLSSNRPPIDVTNNWWGTTSTANIDTRILDFSDDVARGVVNYQPVRSNFNTDAPISSPTGLQITAGTNSLTLNWMANTKAGSPQRWW